MPGLYLRQRRGDGADDLREHDLVGPQEHGGLQGIAPSFRAPYCKPEGLELSVNWAAQIFVEYVSSHPDLLHYPAGRAVLLALRNSYSCPT